jgi:hypothetical protein
VLVVGASAGGYLLRRSGDFPPAPPRVRVPRGSGSGHGGPFSAPVVFSLSGCLSFLRFAPYLLPNLEFTTPSKS